jgi:hypothetical protein
MSNTIKLTQEELDEIYWFDSVLIALVLSLAVLVVLPSFCSVRKSKVD